MNKKVLLLIFAGLILIANITAAENESVEIVVFYGEGCPHCSQLTSFLDDISDEYPELNVI